MAPPPQALYDCYLKLGSSLSNENKQMLCWELIMVGPAGRRRGFCAAAQRDVSSLCRCLMPAGPGDVRHVLGLGQPLPRCLDQERFATPLLRCQLMSEHASKEELVLYPAIRWAWPRMTPLFASAHA